MTTNSQQPAFLPGLATSATRSPIAPDKIKYCISIQFKISPAKPYFNLSGEEQAELLLLCDMNLRDSGSGYGPYNAWCVNWGEVVPEFANPQSSAQVTLEQLHGELSVALKQYSEAVWSKKGGRQQEAILPPNLADMQNPSIHGVYYVWIEQRLVCFHTLTLQHRDMQGQIKPWSFDLRLSSGLQIQTNNVAEIRWRQIPA